MPSGRMIAAPSVRDSRVPSTASTTWRANRRRISRSAFARVPGSVLWLLDPRSPAADNLRHAAERSGVDGERIVFAPHVRPAEHLGRHAIADLFLDTLPYNAHTTANDALFAGLPLLTC